MTELEITQYICRYRNLVALMHMSSFGGDFKNGSVAAVSFLSQTAAMPLSNFF